MNLMMAAVSDSRSPRMYPKMNGMMNRCETCIFGTIGMVLRRHKRFDDGQMMFNQFGKVFWRNFGDCEMLFGLDNCSGDIGEIVPEVSSVSFNMVRFDGLMC